MDTYTFKGKWFFLPILLIGFIVLQIPAYAQANHRLLQGKHNKFADSVVVTADTSVPVLINKIENYSYIIDHTNFIF
ncbi:MAG: hypothetical protein ABJB86_18080 [Bacteroidota bacterium]